MKKPCRVMLSIALIPTGNALRASFAQPVGKVVFASLVMLVLLAGCGATGPATTASVHLTMPGRAAMHTLNLSARQGLRDLTGDFSPGVPGADTGILLLPGEKVEIFASGSAGVLPGGKPSGPQGLSTCQQTDMPEPLLPCYSVIYSIGINGLAGEVGSHIGFDPASTGNLFLGINGPRLSGNTGSFQITVLVIPPGTFTGMWITPRDSFNLQGTSLRLSAYVFAQNATIVNVQFTLTAAGQPAVTICQAFKSGADLYSCDWDITLNGVPFHNGPVTLGFTLNGNRQGGAALAAQVNPDGVRRGMLTYVETQPNDIYAGYAATNLVSSTAYQKVTGRWNVPPASCSPGENSASAVWVGMTSGASDQSLLAQLGTDSDCQNGSPLYFMWWEMFPAVAVPLDKSLQAGDSVTASVTFQNGSFQLSIDVPTEGVHFTTRHAGSVGDTSIAECIVEAPTIVDNLATNQGHVAQLTDFGQLSVNCQLNNNEPIATGPQDILYQMQTNAGIAKATTSALDQSGTTFTVQWQHA